MKWFLPEVDTPAARAILGSTTELHAPDILLAEVCNVLWKRYTREGLTAEEAEEALDKLLTITPIRLHESRGLARTGLAASMDLHHPIYDCLYLALAEALDAPLITADRRLAAAVRGTRWEATVELIGAA